MAPYPGPRPDGRIRIPRGGAILKKSEEVSGMATAAAIWITSAIGMSVALKQYEIAVVLSTFSFMTLHFGTKVKTVIQNGEGNSDET